MDCIREVGIDFKSHAICPSRDKVYKESDLISSVFSTAVNIVIQKDKDKDDNTVKFYICPGCYHLVCIFY